MPVKIRFGVGERGNTIPYPPLVDDIRRNHGYVDLRGQPSAVDGVIEAQESPALRRLLIELARPGSPVISLGCDLGGYDQKTGRLSSRCVAGGYVQLADARLADRQSDFLKTLAAHFEQSLRLTAGQDRWKVNFELTAVAYEFEGRIEAHSVWIWFDADASTRTRATESRERLLDCLTRAAASFAPN